MPDLNEFFYKPEKILKAEMEKINGIKPCSHCNKDAEEAFWDAVTRTLSWECPDGHKNEFKVN